MADDRGSVSIINVDPTGESTTQNPQRRRFLGGRALLYMLAENLSKNYFAYKAYFEAGGCRNRTVLIL